MTKVELKVGGMTCGHCVKAVTAAIQAKDPAANVEVSLAEGLVHVITTLPASAVASAVTEEGYTVSA